MGSQLPRIQDRRSAELTARYGLAHPPELGPLGREVIDLAELAGLTLDPWQAFIMVYAHEVTGEQVWNEYNERYENKWANKEVGVMVSRQNGKGSILEARELAGLFIFGENLIVHSAHQFDTSMEHMRRILQLMESTPDLEREIKSVQKANGKEGIELKSGQRLRFRTRTRGGGRGFTGDCLVLDEAMYLTSEQIGALVPTISAVPNPQIWVTGSAGDQESTHFGSMRHRAMNGADEPSLFWAEWSIDACTDFCTYDCTDHDKPDTVESYAKANPGLGIRITVDHVEMERRSMEADTFAQERLGVGDWPVADEQWKVISEAKWRARADEQSQIVGKFVLGVDTSPDRKYSSIAASGMNEDDMHHVEITADSEGMIHHQPGMQWVVPAIKAINAKGKPVAVVIDKAGQAGSFIDELIEAGIEVVSPLTREFAQGCGEFYSAVVPRKGEEATLIHIDQAPLTTAVAGADKRDLADSWAWNKRTSSIDISPLVAATLAKWGYKKHVFEKKTSAPWVARR